MAKNKSQYDSTLNLPKTLFEMRAGLPKKEPAMLEDWEKNDLYNNLIKHNDGKPKFVLHDGPPYANGNIHMGTALNKIIKDIIIRDKNMEGFQAPYVPGLCTGAPTAAPLWLRQRSSTARTTAIPSSSASTFLRIPTVCWQSTASRWIRPTS